MTSGVCSPRGSSCPSTGKLLRATNGLNVTETVGQLKCQPWTTGVAGVTGGSGVMGPQGSRGAQGSQGPSFPSRSWVSWGYTISVLVFEHFHLNLRIFILCFCGYLCIYFTFIFVCGDFSSIHVIDINVLRIRN